MCAKQNNKKMKKKINKIIEVNRMTLILSRHSIREDNKTTKTLLGTRKA